MRHNESNQWLEDVLSRRLRKKGAAFDFRTWQARYPDATASLQQMRLAETKSTKSWPLIWRTIMKSPYTKYGLAAFCLVILAVFLFPTKSVSPGSILLADVQREVLRQENCFISGMRVLTTHDETPVTTPYIVHKYLSREYGYVDQTFDEEGNLLISLSLHHPSQTVTVLFPQIKRYVQVPVPQKYHNKMKEITPLKLFALFFYEGDYKDLENIDLETLDVTQLDSVKKSTIQGMPSVGFAMADLPQRISSALGFEGLSLFFDMQEMSGNLWINVDTLLPVQIDAEVVVGKCFLTDFTEQTLNEVDDHFEWDIEMDEGLFRPQIPEGYQMLGVPKMKGTTVIGVSGSVAAVPLLLWIRRRRKDRSNLR